MKSNYSGLPITRACSLIKILTIFQPARPFLLHKNEQGGHPYLVPCSLNRACSRNRGIRVIVSKLTYIHILDISLNCANWAGKKVNVEILRALLVGQACLLEYVCT